MKESTRSYGTTFDFASSFSLPPENLVTLLVPTFFGDGKDVPYWGRWFGWEIIGYVGILPLVLAAVAVIHAWSLRGGNVQRTQAEGAMKGPDGSRGTIPLPLTCTAPRPAGCDKSQRMCICRALRRAPEGSGGYSRGLQPPEARPE